MSDEDSTEARSDGEIQTNTSSEYAKKKKVHNNRQRSAGSGGDDDDDEDKDDPIISSPLDPKKYRMIQLPNGLKAILISDRCGPKKLGKQSFTSNCIDARIVEFNKKVLNIPKDSLDKQCGSNKCSDEPNKKANKQVWSHDVDEKDCADIMTAACLNIKRGGFSDPDDLPGLAHFCEHMVFFGSKKYPEQNEFDTFLTNHVGNSNASTRGNQTQFQMKVEQDGFVEALDRFGHFFIAPVMPIDRVLKERDIVDSEFQKRLSNEHFRRNQIIIASGKKPHPVTRFISGNNASLGGRICPKIEKYLHQSVLEFQRKNYVAEVMTLAVQARLTLNTLEDLVVDIFGQIPSGDLKLLKTLEPKNNAFPFDTKEFRRLYKIIPTSDVNWLFVSWELPAEAAADYQGKPLQYIARVLNNQDPGGILYYLKQGNLIDCINSRIGEASHETSEYSCFFHTSFTLTDSGVRNIPMILEAFFSYLNFIRNNGIHEWYFTEFQEIKALNFHFEEAMDPECYVKLLASSLGTFPSKDVIIATELPIKWDPTSVWNYLAMLTPAKANYVITSKEFEDICDRVEPIYRTRYHVEEIPEALLNKFTTMAPYPAFKLFQPNQFLPKSFCKITPTKKDQTKDEPMIIFDNERIEVSHQMTYNFGDKTKYEFKFISPLANRSGQNVVMTDLWLYFLQARLHRTIHTASEAGITCFIRRNTTGFVITLNGFTEKLELLFKIIMKEIRDLSGQMKRDAFNTIKKIYIDQYYNVCVNVNLLQCDVKSAIFISKYWLQYELRILLKCMKFEQFQKFRNDFLQRLFCCVTVVGNVSSETATQIGLNVIEILRFAPLLPQTMPKCYINQLPLGQTILRIKNLNKISTTSQITKYFELGMLDDKIDLFSRFIANLMNEAAFQQLRTKEGLGYSVHISNMLIDGFLAVFGLTVITSSQKFGASFVNERMTVFIRNFYLNTIKPMTKNKFEKAVKKTIDTDDAEKLCINVADVKDMYETFFLPSGEMRQISLQIVGLHDKEYRKEHVHCGKCPENHGRQNAKHRHPSSIIERPDLTTDFPLVILVPSEKSSSGKLVHITSINEFKDMLERYPTQTE